MAKTFGQIPTPDIDSSLDSLKAKAGLPTASSQDAKNPIISTAWDSIDAKNSMFKPITIDGARWNKMFPYRFLVVAENETGGFSIVTAEGAKVFDKVSVVKNTAKGQTRLSFSAPIANWEYWLPITPQQLSVSTPYAISNTALLRGIMEEHNGVKYKIISMAGTFGVWPNRPTVNAKTPSGVASFFTGTIAAAGNLANQVSALSGKISASDDISNNEGGFAGTGYAHALLLDQFLEQYAEAKKNPENARWRLVLDIPKQNQSFLVTPIQFVYNQSAESPNEIKYSLQLKAYKRIDLNASAFENNTLQDLSPSSLQRVVFAVAQSRRIVSAALNLIKAVRSDFQAPLNTLRQVSLFCKDLAGIPAALIDLPNQLLFDLRSAMTDTISNLEDSAQILQKAQNRDKLQIFKEQKRSTEGLSVSAVEGGQLGQTAINNLKTSEINKFFKSPEESFDIFNAVDVSSLSLTPEQQDAVDKEVEAVRNFTVDDLREKRAEILDLAVRIANNFGASTELVSKIYNKPAPYERVQAMTIDEYVILKSLYDVIQSIDVITASSQLDDLRIQNAYDFVNDLADLNDIPFNTATAKILVPVPYGLNMEQIAYRYLGDADRWLEIATLNALKEPYIDEVGFKRSFLSNADGRQFNIESKENLNIGQKITIKSIAQPPTQRRITNIEKITDNNYLISVDGEADLDVYTTTDSSYLQAYLSGTVNSQSQIFIPSGETAPDDIRSKVVPIASQDALVGMSKIDWLQTEDGDIALDAFAEPRLAYGLNNLIQALKMKFSVAAGQLIKNPKFGAGVSVGESTADIELRNLYSQVRETIISDPRFSDINKLEIFLDGPTLTFNVLVTIAQNRGILPISFSVSS